MPLQMRHSAPEYRQRSCFVRYPRPAEQVRDRAGLDQEQLDRELEQMQQFDNQLTEQEKQELRELAKKLGECQKCLWDGDDKDAAEKLDELARLLSKFEKDDPKEILRRLRELQEVKKSLAQCLDGRQGAGPDRVCR